MPTRLRLSVVEWPVALQPARQRAPSRRSPTQCWSAQATGMALSLHLNQSPPAQRLVTQVCRQALRQARRRVVAPLLSSLRGISTPPRDRGQFEGKAALTSSPPIRGNMRDCDRELRTYSVRDRRSLAYKRAACTALATGARTVYLACLYRVSVTYAQHSSGLAAGDLILYLTIKQFC